MNNEEKVFQKSQINWYPGHMAKTKRLIKENYNLIDIVYEVIDARIPYSSKIKDIDDLLKDKPKILVVTKTDLCDNMETDKFLRDYEQQGYVVIPVDLLNNKNINEILVKTKEILKPLDDKRIAKGLKPRSHRALIVGIPNVGKSTLINNLAGKKVAKTGNMPGVTRNNVWLKTKYKVLVLDTPGILWPKFDDEKVALNLCVFSAIKEDVIPLYDVASYILKVLSERYPNILSERFKINEFNDEAFDAIAKNIGAIKNGEADYNRTAKYIINEIKLEHIKGITFDYEK